MMLEPIFFRPDEIKIRLEFLLPIGSVDSRDCDSVGMFVGYEINMSAISKKWLYLHDARNYHTSTESSLISLVVLVTLPVLWF